MKYKDWDASLYQNRHSYVSKYGEDVLELLNPHEGERILDLGCGTGDLAAKIAARGARVLGIDPSEPMLEKARTNAPGATFLRLDARDMEFDSEFDAVFSNAVMHWIPDQKLVAERVFRALKPGGRFVLEFGGKGCNKIIFGALDEEIRRRGYEPHPVFFFRSIGEYAPVLESAGFRVESAWLFDRDTLLEGADGMLNFLNMFSCNILANVPESERDPIFRSVVDRIRAVSFRDGVWHADYVRLRVVARKPL